MSDGAVRAGRLLGYLQAVAAAALWGTSGIFAVYLFRLGVPPETVALLRPLVGVLLLLLVFAFTRRRSLKIDLAGLAVLGLGGGLAVALLQVAYQLSTDAVGVPRTVALLYLAPAFVAAAAGPVLGEWPSRRRVALIALTLAGVWLTVLSADDVAASFGSSGLVWGVLAAVGYAGSTLFGRFATPRFGPHRTVVYSTAGACLILAVVLPVTSGPFVFPTEARPWLLLLAFGGLTIAVAQFLFFSALGRIEASGASVATAVEPAVGAVLATVLLSQGMNAWGWLGVAMIVAGVGLNARAETPVGASLKTP